jgi:chromosome segregation ATPase
MGADEKFQADIEQTKADFSQIRAKTSGAFDAARADARARLDRLEAKRAELKATISDKTGEARTKAQAELDAIEKDIDTYEAANRAAMAEYFEKRDAGEIGLN